MAILYFIVELAGATMLLLFAVRMVRTGIERAFGASFHRTVTRKRNPAALAGIGVTLAMVLQSSAAVTLLVAGFAGSGAVGFAPGMAVVLGGDLGSALLIQILSLRLDWLLPLLLAVGGFLFLKTERRGLKQAGRIILGIALILIALRLLRETMEPIRDSAFLPAISGYLARDFLTAFLAGAALAFVMHSSVAVILMCVTVVAIGALPTGVGLSLVLGANLGSALIPLWLTRGMGPPARWIPAANLMLRGTGSLVALLLVNKVPALRDYGATLGAQGLVSFHILFNAALLVLLPILPLLQGPIARLMPRPPEDATSRPIHHRTVLNDKALGSPQTAIACLRREILRMMQVVEEIVTPIMDIYDNPGGGRAQALKKLDDVVNRGLDGVRVYAASLPDDKLTKPERKQVRELAEYAIALETAGDIVVKRMVPLAVEMAEKRLRFSAEGQEELRSLHDSVLANMKLAANVLVSADIESARLLLEEKSEMARRERSSRKRHLKRLAQGETASFDTSDIHLETAHALKDLNSQIASLAYPILMRDGQLLETRLIRNMDNFDQI
jgi:phosphate:Na+ symporter